MAEMINEKMIRPMGIIIYTGRTFRHHHHASSSSSSMKNIRAGKIGFKEKISF